MKVAIAGATGLVGKKIVEVLEKRSFPVSELTLFASEKSKGETITFQNQAIPIKLLSETDFSNFDIVFFAVNEKIAKEYIPKASKSCVVIDKSAAFRLDKNVPLVVPEVNPEVCQQHKNIIASPNCCTIQLVIVLAALQKLANINCVTVTNLQSVSGAGSEALEQFRYEIENLAVGETVVLDETSPLIHPIGTNLIPQIGEIGRDGYSTEEKKIILETRKILAKPELSISVTCVRVPVMFGHSQTVDIAFDRKVTVSEVISVLQKSPGIKVYRDSKYPMPIDVVGQDEVMVGRIREHLTENNKITLWIVADNLRKGAATNAVQIAELITKR